MNNLNEFLFLNGARFKVVNKALVSVSEFLVCLIEDDIHIRIINEIKLPIDESRSFLRLNLRELFRKQLTKKQHKSILKVLTC